MPNSQVSTTSYQRLRPRDREILRLLARGMDVSAMGSKIGLTPEAIADYCHEIRKELGVTQSEALRAWVLKRVALSGQLISEDRKGQLLLHLDCDLDSD